MSFNPLQQMRMKRVQPVFAHSSTFSNTNHQFQLLNQRRSANYHPSIWDPKFIESLSTPYTFDFDGAKLEELKGGARRLLDSAKEDISTQLNFIDSMQRLGVAYHFEEEIGKCIRSIACWDATCSDLYTTALRFRLLRAHGYSISSDVFDKFRDRSTGRFLESLGDDVLGILSLYEASHLGKHGEEDLEEAMNFSIKHLKSSVGKLETKLAEQVQRSLEVPLHWRMSRAEARNFIDVYSVDDARSSVLLELAELDYNQVQSVYQKELKELAKWWRDLGFKEKLAFSRDRLMENYLWAMGLICEPQFSKCRKGLTKFVCILSAIDDMYDIYGSLDELESFTDAVNRWDINAMDDLPEYMRLCYLAMFNFGNEIAYDGLKEHGLNILPYIKEEWVNLCGSYLVEARWFHTGYTPTFDEYLGNAWISVGGHAAIVHAYLLLGFPITKSSMDCFKQGSQTIYWSSLITRLSDDLGTSKAEMVRGDVAKSIQCYMIKEGVSEEQARDHIKELINSSWRNLNEANLKNFNSKSPIVTMSLSMARTALCIFQHGDGIGTSVGVTKDLLTSLIVTPIPMINHSIVKC
ncbi:probable terpene synthase 9 [Cornus florida]|uniref:probable terpene synthase 9 n=1 Tax=Cornus florida TaxID=4283 RepID=UPI00289BC373|nr:probable terpene synthase 9 [Cornus florida]